MTQPIGNSLISFRNSSKLTWCVIMCRLGLFDNIDECVFDNRRFSHHTKSSINHVFNISTCEPLCKTYNCYKNCQALRNKQVISHIVRVVRSITNSPVAFRNKKAHNLNTAVHLRDYFLQRLDSILPVIGIVNFHLRVLYKGLNTQILAEFRAHQLSPEFTFVNIYVFQLNKVKTLQALSSIQVAHLCQNDIFNLDRLYARQLIPMTLWEQIEKYFDIKCPSCPKHRNFDYYAECQFCHQVSRNHRPSTCVTKRVIGSPVVYSPPGSDGYLSYKCVNN